MTTWLKKLRLYFLRRQLKSVIQRMDELDWESYPKTLRLCIKWRLDLLNRIAEIEKTL